jgi:hypothetical protein
MRRVCFDPEPSEADLALLGSTERWLVYRDLVRTRLIGVIEAAFPRTKAALGTASFDPIIDEWLGTGGPQTRYFRRLPDEFAEFAIPRWQGALDPWIVDLARYEMARWTVRHAPPSPQPAADFSFDTRPLVATGMAVLRINHRVHATPTPTSGYPHDPVVLCIHRDRRHRAVPQELNSLATDLLEAWQRGEETVAESVQRIAAEHGTEIGPAFVEKLSTLITGFLEQGILLGGHGASQ